MVFVALAGMDVNLRREVAAGVDFVIHVQRSVLRVAEVVGGVGVRHTARNLLGVVASGVDALPLFAVHDGGAGILAEGELALSGDFGVAQHCERHELIVIRCLGVVQNLSNHLVMLAAEHEGIVVRGLAGKHGERLRINNEEFMATPVFHLHIVGSKAVILSGIGAERKHRLIMERFSCHSEIYVVCLVCSSPAKVRKSVEK